MDQSSALVPKHIGGQLLSNVPLLVWLDRTEKRRRIIMTRRIWRRRRRKETLQQDHCPSSPWWIVLCQSITPHTFSFSIAFPDRSELDFLKNAVPLTTVASRDCSPNPKHFRPSIPCWRSSIMQKKSGPIDTVVTILSFDFGISTSNSGWYGTAWVIR